MWMRVFLSGPAVRGPASVADAVGAVDRVYADGFFQVAQLAGSSAYRQMVIAIVDCDAGGIVTAVFQAAETIEDDGDSLSIPDVADDAAHDLRIAVGGAGTWEY